MNADRPPRQARRPRSRARPAERRSGEPAAADRVWLYGRHAVAAALANPKRRWRRLAVLAAQQPEGLALIAAAIARRLDDGEPLRLLAREALAALLPAEAVHQGLALEAEPLPPPDLDAVLRDAAAAPPPHIVVALDQVADPHNVGAVLRSAAAFGALAVIVLAHGAPAATGALAKAASGALEQVPLVRVANLARTLDRLKAAGFWVCGLDEAADRTLPEIDLGQCIALVLGAEGSGLRRLVRERCDHLARLPTRTAFATLNVSNAAAIALYELTRSTRS